MSKLAGTPDLAALHGYCQRWESVVQLFAGRRRASRRVDPAKYEQLRQDLLRTCRSVAETGDEARLRVCRRLEDLVGPWLTLAALERADPEVCVDLVRQSREAGRELGRRAGAGLRAAPLTWLLAVAGGLALAAAAAPWLGRRVWGWLQDGSYAAWSVVRQTDDVQRLFAVGFLVTLAAIILVWRAART